MKPNWPLIGIALGAVATVTLVVVMFVSTLGGTGGTGLPTTTALSSVPTDSTSKSVGVSVADDGCVFVTIDGARSLAIWPEGYTQNAADDVLTPDGDVLGQEFTGDVVQTTRAAVLKLSGGGDDGYLGLLLTQCQGSAKPVTIITAVTP